MTKGQCVGDISIFPNSINRWGDISVNQRRQGTGLLICLINNCTVKCFLILYEMLQEFQSRVSKQTMMNRNCHDAFAHCRAFNNWSSHLYWMVIFLTHKSLQFHQTFFYAKESLFWKLSLQVFIQRAFFSESLEKDIILKGLYSGTH